MLFCDLLYNAYPAVTQRPTKIGQGSLQMMGRLIKYDCSRLVFKRLQNTLSLRLFPRQKPLERKPSRVQPRERQRTDHGARPRHHEDIYTSLPADPHQILSRIGYSRHPRIRDERNGFSIDDLIRQLMRLLYPVVLVVAGHRRLYIKMVQKLYRISRILRGYQLDLLQYPDRAKGHILKISDGRSHQI